jgi:hypothetical protein
VTIKPFIDLFFFVFTQPRWLNHTFFPQRLNHIPLAIFFQIFTRISTFFNGNLSPLLHYLQILLKFLWVISSLSFNTFRNFPTIFINLWHKCKLFTKFFLLLILNFFNFFFTIQLKIHHIPIEFFLSPPRFGIWLAFHIRNLFLFSSRLASFFCIFYIILAMFLGLENLDRVILLSKIIL